MDTMYSRADIQEMINASVDAAYMGMRQLQGAQLNRAFSTGSATNPSVPTVGASRIVGAAKLQAQVSGIFLASVVALVTGVTATDTLDFTVSTQTAAAGITLTNATKVGPGKPQTTAAGATPGAWVSNVAGGITVGAGGGTLVQVDSGAQVAPNAGTTMTFSWASIIQNSIAATASEAPFTIGNDVLLTLGINQNANALVWAGFAITLIELY